MQKTKMSMECLHRSTTTLVVFDFMIVNDEREKHILYYFKKSVLYYVALYLMQNLAHELKPRDNQDTIHALNPVPGKCLGIVNQGPGDSKFNRLHVCLFFLAQIEISIAKESKSNQLHVDIFRFCFHLFEVYSILGYSMSSLPPTSTPCTMLQPK